MEAVDGEALEPYGHGLLAEGIRSRKVPGVEGLTFHLLEAGYETPGRPVVLLCHGFPELAFSWRHQMRPLAAAGYHVLAPDLRGFGRTTGWDGRYEADLHAYGFLAKVRDMTGLLRALGHDSVAAVVGHDLGSPVAAWCALVRPDVFRSAILMSAPFGGPPPHPLEAAHAASPMAPSGDLAAGLAALPRPRQYYIHYNQTREAAADWNDPPQGLHDFFRAYYHHKSADWKENRPFPLAAATAAEFAKMPTYYVMDLGRTLSGTVAEVMPSPEQIAACEWLTEADVAVHVAEYRRTGFQGALNAAYRMIQDPRNQAEARTFSGRTLDVPTCFIAGEADWGIHQTPGSLEAMQTTACTRFEGVHLVPGASHWVQQEQPAAVTERMLDFLAHHAPGV